MNKPTLRDLFKSEKAYNERNERIDFSRFEKEAKDGKRVRELIKKSAEINEEDLRKIKFNIWKKY